VRQNAVPILALAGFKRVLNVKINNLCLTPLMKAVFF
jgi:hypothetical protein